MKFSEFKIEAPFNKLWPVDSSTVDKIAKNMRETGFDSSESVVVWEREDGEKILIDGHTRVQAAEKAGLEGVQATTKNFASEDDALEYAIHRQKDRRNLNDAALLMCTREIHKRKKSGGQPGNKNASKTKSASEPIVPKKSSAKETAKQLNTSETKVKKALTIDAHADKEIKDAIESGEMSLNAGYKETQQKRRAAKEKKQENQNIESSFHRLERELIVNIKELKDTIKKMSEHPNWKDKKNEVDDQISSVLTFMKSQK